MTKFTYEDKINIYQDRKNGMSIKSICSKYKIQRGNLEYLVRLIDNHGLDVLRTTKNKYYSVQEKEEIINRVILNNESILSVAIYSKLPSSGMLINWIKKYKENGYNIVERKRGRSPTIMKKPKQTNKIETDKEKIVRLEKENEYLKAELEYSKKLRAVVQARKNRQQKKK